MSKVILSPTLKDSEPRFVDAGKMNEYIRPTSLLIVKPFHNTTGHGGNLPTGFISEAGFVPKRSNLAEITILFFGDGNGEGNYLVRPGVFFS